MAGNYHPPQTAMTGYLPDPSFLQVHEPSQLSTYSMLDPSQYSDSLAYWHNPPAQRPGMSTPGSSYTSQKQPSLRAAPDQKKHKRTRSGCFTCRARRIKCDEGRPICERCKKGNRDCVYPSPTTSSSKSGGRSAAKSGGQRPRSQDSDSSDHAEPDETGGLETIVDEEVEEVGSGSRRSPSTVTSKAKTPLRKSHSSHSLAKRRIKQIPEISRKEKDTSSSPCTESSTQNESASVRSTSIGHSGAESFGPFGSNQLSEDLRFYLNFHQEFLTYHHYSLRSSGEHFMRHSLIELAMQYEPLLYAVVGFSAYHHSLHNPGGKLYTFLKYYNTALTLLRKSLSSGEPHTEATLITVLVLATFEEYIGDWVNLIDHHQAAHALMHELLTPESTNLNELHRQIFVWCARFDVVAGILAGNETILSRDWYMAREEFDAEQAAMHPDDIQKQLTLVHSLNRRFGLDMASLYAKLSRRMITIDEFVIQNEQLSQTLERLKNILKRYDDSEYTVRSYPHKQPLTDDDIVNPYLPGGLHQGPLWELNFAWIDFLSTKLMFKYQSFITLGQTQISELQNLALEQCRLIEAIDRWPGKENGYFIAFKNSLGISSMFLPKDHKHTMWSRRKLVVMEQNGYIYAPKLRAGLAAVWEMPELKHWWLPNEEGYPGIVREIRAMTEERINKPRDNFREDVRDMKTLFWKLNLDDTASETSPNSSRSGNP